MKIERSSPEQGSRYQDIMRLLEFGGALGESYETFIGSLRLLNGARPVKTLLFTSAQPEEGKTTVAVGLALAMVRAGRRVLIVDADLRRPAIHRIFGLQNTKGLADVVARNLAATDAVQAVEFARAIEGKGCALSVVTSGRSATAFDAIQSPLLAAAIRSLADVHDAVLIDSPPVLSVSDPLLLAPLVDGVVLIVHTGAVSEADARRAKQRLEQAGGRVIGVVMNRFDETIHGPGVHPYHGYYTAPAGKS